jgi:hypothetical protein
MSAHQRHLSVMTDPKTNLDAQMRELIQLRELVRKAQLSARTVQRKSRRKKNAQLE